MAAGMIYTIGGSFWEFGGPDLERAKLFVMIGTAEDHHSNPLKIAISKFKRSGGRFISVNPVRTGYSAIADEWVPIRPGTDGALLLAIIHEIIQTGLYDRDFLARYTNAGYLIDVDPQSDRYGLPVQSSPRGATTTRYTVTTSCGGTARPTGWSARWGVPALVIAAFFVQYTGLIAERWYFFAQARHPQNLYYGAIS